MNYLQKILLTALSLLLANSSWARTKTFQGEELVRTANVIAIVQISSTEYTAGSLAPVVRSIKGTAPSKIKLPANDNWECYFGFKPGQYLVFLLKQDGRFLSPGCGQSWMPIVRGRVRWSRGYPKGKEEGLVPLTAALEEINSLGAK